jgi:hypothetical protein
MATQFDPTQYFLGSGLGVGRFNQPYRPKIQDILARMNRPEITGMPGQGVYIDQMSTPQYVSRTGPDIFYQKRRDPLGANLYPNVPGMGFTPSAGLMDMGGEMQPLSEQVQAAPQAAPMQEAPLQTFEEAYPDLSQQVGAAPRRTLGLLGDMFGGASALDEYMTPEQKAQLQNQGVMAAAMQLLASSGASRVPVGLGQALGEAYGAGQKGYTAAQDTLLKSMTMKQKMDEYKRLKDIQARISGALIGEGAPAMPGAAISPEQAINAPGLPAGPTVARAALIGTPGAAAPMSQADILHDRYMNASSIAAQYGDAETAKKYADLAKQIRPQQETQGEPYRAADGNMYIRLKSGASIPYQGMAPAAKPSGKPEQRMVNGVRTMVQFFDDGTYEAVSDLGEVVKPTGSPFKVTDASGKQVLLSQMSDGTYQTLQGFGPQREMVQVDVGGSIKFIDKDKVAAGTSFTKGLAPQIVGSADTGFFVYGGGGGGGTTVGGRAPAPAVGAAGAEPAPGGRQAAPGMTQIIPGTSFKNDEQLRGEYTRNMEPFVKLAQAFEKVQVAALNPSGAGDISLIYGYMKILDPGSTVMQGEQASAQNAGSVPESIRAKYNSIIAGDKLDPNVRADFLNQARLIVESQRTMADDVRDRYSELAKAYGLKPEQIVFDPFRRIKAPGEVVKSATPIKANDWWKKFDLLPKP